MNLARTRARCLLEISPLRIRFLFMQCLQHLRQRVRLTHGELFRNQHRMKTMMRLTPILNLHSHTNLIRCISISWRCNPWTNEQRMDVFIIYIGQQTRCIRLTCFRESGNCRRSNTRRVCLNCLNNKMVLMRTCMQL